MKKPGLARVLRRLLAILAVIAVAGGVAGYFGWRKMNEPPVVRLALSAVYPGMPADARHRYVNLPIDYEAADSPLFREFYILSPAYEAAGPVVFFFTDGQMELVTPGSDASFFDAELPGLSYVLIGHRGHAPTLFPEVYVDGEADLRRAMRLYGSAARVEDIERVRREMLRLKLLPEDGRIMIFAASGAGVLAQQYLQEYGDHVSRVLLVSTGAPDLSLARGWDYARTYADYDAAAASTLRGVLPERKVSPENLGYLLFQLGRQGSSGRETQLAILNGLRGHNRLPYLWHWLHPGLNLPVTRKMLQIPAAEAVKVRMFELLATDLRKPRDPESTESSLIYSWAPDLLSEYLHSELPSPAWRIDRGKFKGEVLVITGQDDIVFSPGIGAAIAAAYPDGQFLAVPGGHRLELDREYHAAVRAAFFQYGLHDSRTQALLIAAPTG